MLPQPRGRRPDGQCEGLLREAIEMRTATEVFPQREQREKIASQPPMTWPAARRSNVVNRDSGLVGER